MNGRRQTVGLCMIVRDEAAVIERCLASVGGQIDTWTICDTGSRDGTPDVVARALRSVPGALHRRPWRDFGANRSELMELAADSADYLLLLDADMTVERRGPLPSLTADAYQLRHAGDLDYVVPRLIRGVGGWRFVGPTHEYLTREGAFSTELLPELVVHHHADGGTRGEKFERDARLLERALESDPSDPRTIFYLAQTYRDLGREAEAIELYRRRVTLGGWDEEVFYAAYQAGVLTGVRDPDAAIPLLLEAWELRPSRAEPLYEASRLSRLMGRHRTALMLAARGREIPYPSDTLFVHRDVYRWRLDYEWSVAAYWAGALRDALVVTDRLLADGRLPADHERSALENRRYCVAGLPPGSVDSRPGVGGIPLTDLAPHTQIGEIRLEVEPDWPQFNPSIAPDGDGFRMIVRTANYHLGEEGYGFFDADGVTRTLNYGVILDGGLALQSVEPLEYSAAEGPPRFPSMVEGLEDCRLFAWDQRWFALCTVRDRSPSWVCQVALLELDNRFRVHTLKLLDGPDPQRHEKNWMPFDTPDGPRIVYSCGPTRILALDPDTGRCSVVSEQLAPWAAALRGGSQGIPTVSGHLFVVHEVFVDASRTYVHRLVEIDHAGRLRAASPRFRFTADPVEMCTGLARQGDRLVMSFGAGDRLAALALCEEQELLRLLVEV